MLPEESPERPYRIADSDRDRVVAMLRLHCSEGRITLDEFSDRVGAVYAARTSVDLNEVVVDLPGPWSEPEPAVAAPDHHDAARVRRPLSRLFVSIFGDSIRRGRFKLEDDSTCFALFGDCELDLTQALIESPNPLITAIAVFGGVTVIVPDGIRVELDGIAVFGDKRSDPGDAPPVPGSPVVLVRAFALFGDVRVRPPRPRGAGRWRSARS